MKKINLLILFCALVFLFSLVTSHYIKLDNNQDNQASALEQLRSLPYLTHTKEKVDETKRGVVKYDPRLAFDGYNLYGSTLIDMGGNIVHSWSVPIWCGIISEEGNIFSMWSNKSEKVAYIGKYNWDSNTIWEKNIITHHEIALSPDNTILTASKEMKEYNGRKVEFDIIIELSQDGKEISRWLTYENFDELKKFHKPSPLDSPEFSSDIVYVEGAVRVGGDYDYYHLNSIQVLPETPIGKKDSRFQAGNWLVSFCFVNLIVILDKETKEIVWGWGPGDLAGQHSPLMLDNGNILIYDNGLNRKDFEIHRFYTRIIELDPIKKEVVWEYKAFPPESFHCPSQGYAQRLPNENTLITDSENGRVFEVTKEGEIVWEWFNPEINEEGKRKGIYRMVCYPKNKIDKLLELNIN